MSAENIDFYHSLASNALRGVALSLEEGVRVLHDDSLELLLLLQAAFQVRRHYFGRRVRLQILNNVQNGYCPEDCHYCAQAVDSTAPITPYRCKSEEEILAEAEAACQAGAYRYCMVLSGRGPNEERVVQMASLVRRIKARWPMEVCLSAGFIDQEMALALKNAGLDRYNHNLNTAEGHYGTLCHTHTYQDRLATLQTARRVGLEVCSGLIVGMGESDADLWTVANSLRQLQARSIPVNFYVHIPGNRMGVVEPALTPERCLRVLCLFRFLNPDAELRAAGGREVHMRSLSPLLFYPANALFSAGYLNTTGQSTEEVMAMIVDAGFEVERSAEVG
ncbi:MAG: biotin synthase BioB [Magnetococcales bacterium]|nr:biotin synthase BioB [Magnetococcales bacterium]